MNTQSLLGEDIINILGLGVLPDEEKSKMLEKMTELIAKRIMLRVAESLSVADQKQVIASEHDPIAVLDLISRKVSNFEEIIKEEVIKLKQEMAQVAGEAV